jgi:tetratricopeptide (TPR) repeat protein
MRAMAPGPGIVESPRGSVAALERLAWLREESTPVTTARRWQWLTLALLAAMVGGALLGIVTAADPITDEVRLTTAFRAQQAGDLDTAARLYADVVADDPGNAVAQFNLGVIEHTQGEVVVAAERYQAAIDADPIYVPALFNLAVLRAELSPTAAIDLYRSVLAIEPDHPAANLNLGLLLLEQGDAVEGSSMIDRALALDPSLQLD